MRCARFRAPSRGTPLRCRHRNSEWVEITNTTRDGINLRGWTLRDRDGNRYRVWDNGSDTATLRDDRGRTVDTESWGRRR
ncbi:lamin tail domain-containing protein [Streptomyces virginiae]